MKSVDYQKAHGQAGPLLGDAAVQGDADAVSRIVDHYSGYIAAYALRTSRDQYGFPRVRVDEDLRRRLETKLILGIL